jgi:sporulation protein YlmC with PRC-barrel domain
MKIRTKLVVLTSIFFLAAIVFIGCGDQDDQAGVTDTRTDDWATAPDQDQDWAETEDQTDQDYAMPDEQDQMTQDQQYGQSEDQMTQDQQFGQAEDQMTQDQQYGQSGDQMTQDQQFGQVQNLEEFVGRQVADSEGNVLGSVSDFHSAGETEGFAGFVFIQGEGQDLHAVPSDLLSQTSDGQLTAAFDQQTFQQSPTFSQEEIQQLSEDELGEVRGYYQAYGEPVQMPLD